MANVEKEVARLDGFLRGVASMNGGLRSYSAYAYIVESQEGRSIEQSLKDFYYWDAELDFSDREHLNNGLRDLEAEIGPLLAREVPSKSGEQLTALQKYLAFKVMEMISVAKSDEMILDVIRLRSTSKPLASECLYFCMRLKGFFIVLQFNDDNPYVDGLAAV